VPHVAAERASVMRWTEDPDAIPVSAERRGGRQ